MKAKPYIGITGFKTVEEITAAKDAFAENGIENKGYLAMFGFLCSQKKLDDINLEGTQSPALSRIPELASGLPAWALPMMHYHTKEKDTLDDQVKRLFQINDLYNRRICNSVQLNVDWPSIRSLGNIISEMPGMKIVLQFPNRAIEGLSIGEIAAKAGKYAKLASYALIDKSGGKGVSLDTGFSTDLMLALREAMPNTRIGLAGGLSGENVAGIISGVSEKFDEPFCIDAQGRLRTEDKLSLDKSKVADYARESGKYFFK